MDIGWTIDFFKNNPTAVDIFTWHEYPLGSGGSDDVADKIMDPNFADKVAKRIETYKSGVHSSYFFTNESLGWKLRGHDQSVWRPVFEWWTLSQG